MTKVSYRIRCEDCEADTVIKEEDFDDSSWSINSPHQHSGLCPSCDPTHHSADQEVRFEQLDNIGESGAENLRESGIVTRQDVMDASDEDILDVSWVGDGGLESIREEVQ